MAHSFVSIFDNTENVLSDIPELDDDFFTKAKLWPGKKKQITLRLDPDVILSPAVINLHRPAF